MIPSSPISAKPSRVHFDDAPDAEVSSQHTLREVLNSTRLGFIALDRDLAIRLFTPATRSVFSLRDGDIGRPLAEMSTRLTDPTLFADARLVLANRIVADIEAEGQDQTWFRRQIMPWMSADGDLNGVVITYSEITHRRKVNAAFAAAEQVAQQATAAKSRFLAVASHDLRQPLQTLVILQGLLANAVSGPRLSNLVERLDETLTAMSRMLDVLLDINQIDAGVIRPDRKDFAINDILARLLEEFSLNARVKGLDLRVIGSKLVVHSDPELIEQMLRNLVSNAVKYTLTGKVLIGCRRRGGSVEVQVLDTGIGIPESELSAVFEEFHQINNPARESGQGLGLGLNIVHRLGLILGHPVEVRSRLGVGSMFLIDLPIGVDPEPIPLPTHGVTLAHSVVLSGQTGNILIVEDDPEVRSLLQILLQDQGYETAIAEDGPKALKLLTSGEFRPDLLLSDYNLPGGMDGLALTVEVRRRFGADLPTVLLTGDISTMAMRRIAEHTVLHLAKPVTVGRLTAAVSGLLEKVISRVVEPAPVTVAVHRAAVVEGPVICLVDDDTGFRLALRELLEQQGRRVQDFSSCESFLAEFDPAQPGCLLLDAYLPGMDGLALLAVLRGNQSKLPVILMTGHSDVAIAVAAMRAGAVDFIEKPASPDEITASIDRALVAALAAPDAGHIAEKRDPYSGLTPRQCEVLDGVLAGQASKNIAYDLGISQRTVESHRAAIMDRLGARSLAELVRIVLSPQPAA